MSVQLFDTVWKMWQQRTRLRLVHSHGGISLAVQSLALFFVVALDQVLFLAVALLRLVRLKTKTSGSGARPCSVGLSLLQLVLLVVDLRLLLLIRVVGLLLARGRRQGVGVILRRHGDFAGADGSSVIVRQSVMGTLETGARRGALDGSGRVLERIQLTQDPQIERESDARGSTSVLCRCWRVCTEVETDWGGEGLDKKRKGGKVES